MLLDKDDSILCVIDIQDFFLGKLSAARATRVVDSCRFLMEAAGRLGIPLFVTVEDPARNGPTTAPLRALLGAAPEHPKVWFGLTSQPDLHDAILAQPRRTAVVIGLETDVCVLHSAVGLKDQGFRAVVVADATAAPGAEHDQGLARAAALGCEVMHAKSVYYEWVRGLETLARVKGNAPLTPPSHTRL